MLGSLEDYLAPPGALRLHAKDDEWKTRFDERARRAACIIVEVSKSDNLLWECEHLRSEGFEEKLFLLTRPSKEGIALPVGLLGNAVAREGNPHHHVAGIRDRLEEAGTSSSSPIRAPEPCLASIEGAKDSFSPRREIGRRIS